MESVTKRPLIRQGWLRSLLFLVFYLGIGFLMIIPALLLVGYLKNGEFQLRNLSDGIPLLKDEFLWLIALSSFCGSVLVVFLFRRFVDRKSFYSLGFSTTGHGSDAATGFFLPIVLLGLGSLILLFSHHLQWVDIDFDASKLIISLGILILVAFGEEMVFRGYLLWNLMESFNKWVALLISALLFGLVHINNDTFNFIALVNIFLAGVLLGLNYLYTKNLWYSIMLHIGWNFMQGPLLGFKVSGINMPSLLQMDMHGDEILTGGSFGFEGSIFNFALSIGAILFIYWMYEKKYKVKESEI